MVAIRARFDGKVFVPDEPVDLPTNQRVVIHVDGDDQKESPSLPPPTTGKDILKFAGLLDPQSAKEMSEAIEQEFGRIDRDEW